MLHTHNITGKWADWLVFGVRFNERHQHIELLFTRADLGPTISGKNETFTRKAVIDAIERGTTFCTIFMQNGNWTKGSVLHVVVVHGVKYLRTTPDYTPRDNLDNLPEY